MHSSTLFHAAVLAASFLSRDVEVLNESIADGLVGRAPELLEARAGVFTVQNFEAGSVKVTADAAITTIKDAGSAADRAGAITTIFNAVMSIIDKLTGQDTARRIKFTQKMAADTLQAFPGSTVIVVNVGYQFTGTPSSKQSVSYKAKIGANVSFDVLTFTTGTFTLKGDGGFQNWAFIAQGNCVVAKPTITCT